MSGRKGISPIISAVLLVAVSLGVVGVFSGWAPQLVKSITQSTSNSTQQRISCNKASIEIMSAHWTGSETAVAVRNRGRTELDNVTFVAYSGDVITGQNYSSLSDGEVANVTVNTSNNPTMIQALSQECGSVTDSTEDITT